MGHTSIFCPFCGGYMEEGFPAPRCWKCGHQETVVLHGQVFPQALSQQQPQSPRRAVRTEETKHLMEAMLPFLKGLGMTDEEIKLFMYTACRAVD